MTSTDPQRQGPSVSRILLAVDFSPSSRQAATLARMFAELYGARLWITHVVKPAASLVAAFVHPAGAIESAEQQMARFLASQSWHGIPCQTVIRSGELWPVLANIVEKNGIDLIVAGTHGRNWLTKVALGSAAELIVRNAKCPVLTVSPRTPSRVPDGLLRFVVPLDGQHHAESALAYTMALANENNAQFVFLHVLHHKAMPVDYPDEEIIDDDRYAAAMERLREIIPGPERFRRDPDIVIESGVPADTIVTVAMRTGADMIVMPVRRAQSLARSRVPWKTAYRVISHATCPVLTLAE